MNQTWSKPASEVIPSFPLTQTRLRPRTILENVDGVAAWVPATRGNLASLFQSIPGDSVDPFRWAFSEPLERRLVCSRPRDLRDLRRPNGFAQGLSAKAPKPASVERSAREMRLRRVPLRFCTNGHETLVTKYFVDVVDEVSGPQDPRPWFSPLTGNVNRQDAIAEDCLLILGAR